MNTNRLTKYLTKNTFGFIEAVSKFSEEFIDESVMAHALSSLRYPIESRARAAELLNKPTWNIATYLNGSDEVKRFKPFYDAILCLLVPDVEYNYGRVLEGVAKGTPWNFVAKITREQRRADPDVALARIYEHGATLGTEIVSTIDLYVLSEFTAVKFTIKPRSTTHIAMEDCVYPGWRWEPDIAVIYGEEGVNDAIERLHNEFGTHKTEIYSDVKDCYELIKSKPGFAKLE